MVDYKLEWVTGTRSHCSQCNEVIPKGTLKFVVRCGYKRLDKQSWAYYKCLKCGYKQLEDYKERLNVFMEEMKSNKRMIEKPLYYNRTYIFL